MSSATRQRAAVQIMAMAASPTSLVSASRNAYATATQLRARTASTAVRTVPRTRAPRTGTTQASRTMRSGLGVAYSP
jgi:hypothetical protein